VSPECIYTAWKSLDMLASTADTVFECVYGLFMMFAMFAIIFPTLGCENIAFSDVHVNTFARCVSFRLVLVVIARYAP
jgi:hypothetical protein